MPRKSEQEWQVIEQDYISNSVPYRILEDKYNISQKAICDRFRKTNIEQRKDKYLRETTIKIEEGRIKDTNKMYENIIIILKRYATVNLLASTTVLEEFKKKSEQSGHISPVELAALLNKLKVDPLEAIKIVELLSGRPDSRTLIDFNDPLQREERMGLIGVNINN